VSQRGFRGTDTATGKTVTDELVRLSPIESAVDDAIGEDASQPPLPEVPPTLHPLEALEAAVLPALEAPPCLVAFSGGRDSSLVLAVAARVARREGLPLPIPLTLVFPDHPDTHESEWQRVVLRHLAIADHRREVFRGELNLLGPAVRDSIRRHGLIAPAATHLTAATMTEIRGTRVLTGADGDGLFNGGSFAAMRAVMRGRTRPTVRTPLTLARGFTPRSVRRLVARRRDRLVPTWLRPDPLKRLQDLDAAEMATEPPRWDRYVAWWARRRHVAARVQAMAFVAETYEVELAHPLMDRTFLASVALNGGALGWGRRTDALDALFPGLLPATVVTRASKADSTRLAWSGDAREFIAAWDGTGLPRGLIDVEALRRVWHEEKPDARTGLLLHAAWTATLPPHEVKEPFNCRLD
jgi:hypothetical protein